MNAHYRLTRAAGHDPVLKTVQMPTDPTAPATIEVDIETKDMRGAQLHYSLSCPQHYKSGGGPCQYCGARGSTFPNDLEVWGLKIVSGRPVSQDVDAPIRCTIELKSGATAPFGRDAISRRGYKIEDGVWRIEETHGSWFNLTCIEGRVTLHYTT